MRKMIAPMVCLALMTGCSLNSGSGPEVPSEALQYDNEVYKIGIGDSLAVSVWRNPELSATVPVRPDGMISVPLMGDVAAAGKEPGEVEHPQAVQWATQRVVHDARSTCSLKCTPAWLMLKRRSVDGRGDVHCPPPLDCPGPLDRARPGGGDDHGLRR